MVTALAATRLPLLATILVGVVAVVALRAIGRGRRLDMRRVVIAPAKEPSLRGGEADEANPGADAHWLSDCSLRSQ